MKEFYTQEEAANRLRYPQEYLLKQLFNSKAIPLCPAVYITSPIPMKMICECPETIMKDGLFDLFLYDVDIDKCLESEHLDLLQEGAPSAVKLSRELEAIAEMHYRYGTVTEDYKKELRRIGIRRFIVLIQDGIDYIVGQSKEIPLSKLLVSRQSLNAYADRKDIDLVDNRQVMQEVQEPTDSQQAYKARPAQLDRTGSKGSLTTLLQNTLKDLLLSGKELQHGMAFPAFVNFIHKRFSDKPRPAYMQGVLKAVDKDSEEVFMILTDRRKTKTYNRKYIQKQFNKIKGKTQP